MNPLCECGCNEPAKFNKNTKQFNRFLTGHNSKLWMIRKPRESFTCLFCGTIVDGMPSEMRNRKYCSAKCRDDHRRSRTGEDNPDFKRFFVPCARCSETTERTDKHGPRRPVYCSPKCAQEAKSEKISAALTGRVTDTWNYHRRTARDRDGGKCRLCDFSLVTHVHHIIPKAKGGKHAPGNLITLSPNHHAMAHAGMLNRSVMLEAIK